ncbi:MAG: hypothetical protein ACTHOH_05020 [Lysobacteraceae bacterium]
MNDLPDDLAQFARVWNGSEPGWVVHVHHDDSATIWIPIPAEGITPAFFKAVRSVLPGYSVMSTSEFRARLLANGGIETERLDGYNAYDHHLRFIRAVHDAERRVRATTSCLLIHEEMKIAKIIEDDDLNRRVAEEAIRRGLEVRESTT